MINLAFLRDTTRGGVNSNQDGAVIGKLQDSVLKGFLRFWFCYCANINEYKLWGHLCVENPR